MDMKNWNVDKTQIAAQQEALKKSMNFAYVGHGPKATGFMAKQFKRGFYTVTLHVTNSNGLDITVDICRR